MKPIITTVAFTLFSIFCHARQSKPSQQPKSSDTSIHSPFDSINARQLKQVEVTGKKPMVEQRLDRTIIHVDASPVNAGMNALEILEKSPGVTLDKDGVISLNGKLDPLILIDGKPTYLGPAELASLLSSMTGAQLDQVEIMSNPPAKYDAAGNAGVINIRTKKLKQQGFNGSLTLGGAVGTHLRSTNSASLNYHKGKVNLFANYSYTYSKTNSEFHLLRNIRNQQTQSILQTFDQTTIIYSTPQSHTFKTGLDFDLTKKTTVGFVVTGLFSPEREEYLDTTLILDPHRVLDSLTVSNSHHRSHFNNIGANLNLRQTFRRPGQELNADLDYLHYNSGSDQLFNNFFYDPKLNPIDPATDLFVHLPAKIDIYSAKVDYTQPLIGKVRLDLGAKSSYVRADNNAAYFDGTSKEAPMNSSLTNHFIYKENIQAGYINLNAPINPHWTAQAGLRVEHTHAEGDQLVSNQDFKRNYTQLFPTAYVEYALNPNNKFAVDYGRRIQRPGYQSLNPFLYFLDIYTFQAGNPNLKPQLSNTIELKHSFRDFLTSSISYSKTDDIISTIINQVDSTKIDYKTLGNVASSVYYSASLSFNHAVTSWWKVNAFVLENYNHLRGMLNNAPLDLDRYTFNANITNQFEVRKGLTLELSGFYSTGRFSGTYQGRPVGSMNFGASQLVLKNKGTVRLSVRDFANLLNYDAIVRFQNSDQLVRFKPESRVVSLSFTYRFSKGKMVKQRQHTSGSEDEQERVKSGN